MTEPSEIFFQETNLSAGKLSRLANYFSWMVITIAALAIIGWQFNVEFFKRPLPRLAAMNPMTAVLFILSGIALLLLENKESIPATKKAGHVIAIIIIILATIRIIDILVAFNIPVDHFLFARKLIEDSYGNIYNHMAPNTAVSFILAGIALLWLHRPTKNRKIISQYMAMIVALVAIFSIIGYLYKVHAFYGILAYFQMAVNSAICFLLLSVAFLFSTSQKGIMKELTGNLTGSVTALPLIISALIIPIILGWLRLLGDWQNLFSVEFGTALLILAIIVVFLAIIWHNTVLLNRRDLQKQAADHALKENEEHVKMIFDAAPDAVIVMDEDGTIVKWNAKAESMLGWKQNEVLGETLGEIIIPGRFREAHQKGMQHFLRTGEGIVIGKVLETQSLTKEGKEIDIALNIAASAGVKNQLLFIGFIRDITDRKKEEERLRKVKKDFELLVSSVKDYAIFLLDKEGRVNSWNSGAEYIKGYTSDEVIGQPIDIFYTAEELERGEPKKNLEKARKYGHHESEGYLVRKDGSLIYANVTFTALFNEEGELYGYAKVTKDITEKRKAENKMRFLATIANNIQDPVISADNNAVITKWNEAAENLLEWKSDEVLGKKTTEILRTTFPFETRELIFESLKEKGFWQGEVIYYTKSGRAINVISTASHLTDAEGNNTGTLVLARDITERKQAERQLREFQYFFNNSNDFSCIANTEGYFEIVNPSFNKALGYSESELSSSPFLDFVHPDDISNTLEAYGQLKAGVPVINFANRYRKKNGDYLLLDWNATPNTLTGKLYCIARDITEKKLAEDALIKLNEELELKVIDRTKEIIASEKLYRSIYENTGEAILLTKPDGTILSANGTACKIFEMTEEEICALGRAGVVNSKDKRVAADLEERRINGALRGEWTFIKKDGSIFPGELSSTIFKNSEGEERTITIIRDISERKKVEEKIRDINVELEKKVLKRTEELQAANSEMEAFSYSVSHDLRAPLRGIIGFTTILEEDYVSQLDDEAKRITSVIKINTAKMGNLIDDLLSFSRIGRKPVDKTTINTNELVKDIITELSYNGIESRIEWKIHHLPELRGDANTIKQVWINLVSNAIKYSRNNDHPKVEIGSKSDENKITFFVKDNGVGFDEKYKQKLFKVFQRLHSPAEFEGTGVGLAIVEKVISKHGGKVWAEGELNNGACFYFSLPA